MSRPKLIDDATIRQLMAMPLAVQAFPFLQAPPKLLPKASCCGKRQAPQYNYNTMKATIANMSSSEKQTLLRLLGVPVARVIYLEGGVTVEKPVAP